MESFLILNSIQCNSCEEILISRHRHDCIFCKCHNHIMLDGGLDGYVRIGGKKEDYTNLCIYSDAKFEVIRESLYRGTYGKLGKSKLKYIKLKDMTTNHILGVIKYFLNNKLEEDTPLTISGKHIWYLNQYLNELEFRDKEI